MYFLFDIGGTKMRFGVSSDGINLEKVEVVSTTQNYEEGIGRIKKYFESLGDVRLTAVSGAFPGTFNGEKSEIVVSKNMPGWVNKPVKLQLEEIFETKVILSNDADMAGLGEALFGSGKNYNIVAYLSVSTGVGGTRIIEGKLDVGMQGFEPGYQIIDLDGSVDKELLGENEKYKSTVGYLQRLVSGSDLAAKNGNKLENVNDPLVWDSIAKYLAAGINNVMSFWSPDIVVLGGGVSMSANLSLDKITNYLKEYSIIFPRIPVIKKAELGDNSALYGALEYIKTRV